MYEHANAHEQSITSCDWGVVRAPKPTKNDGDNAADRMAEDGELPRRETTSDCIVTASTDCTVKTWVHDDSSAETLIKLDKTMEDANNGFVSVAFNSDASRIVASSFDSVFMLWDTVTGRRTNVLYPYEVLDMWDVAFSPVDNCIITGGHTGNVSAYCTETGLLKRTYSTGGKFVLSVAYSPDGKYIASGAVNGIVNVFDVSSGGPARTLVGHAMPIRSLRFSPDSKYLLTGSDDCQMRMYDVHNARTVDVLCGHFWSVLSVDFSPDCKYLVSGSSDKTVRIWDFNSRECVRTFRERKSQVNCVRYSPAGDKFVSVTEEGSIVIYPSP